ncbi:MAG TPA: 4-(cytidine 5'-diphospho)-2-C-methyl-D-erythritol kinase [Micropepsaceae bacterium]|nr:4-(cytidine 5'-diphospho)-2-C-methyl-D-erythritol kinase [Micropepsaceae bacterium]
MTARVSVFAPAKINLFLHVGEKRDDGYHALESLVAFAETGDRLTFAPADDVRLDIVGPFANRLLRGEDNLVLKAARALKAAARPGTGISLGAAIRLEKNIPVAAGLGGGSADAAAALRGLNAFWKLGLAESELLQLATTLGSDVPACLLSRTCWMEGRGEFVKDVPPLPNFPIILVNPGVLVPTGPIFADLNARTGVAAMRPPGRLETVWDLVAYLADAANDLEAPACRFAPLIEDVLSALDREPGCVLAQMSGSGATCFGLFEQEQFALGAAERIAQDHRDWWVRATRLASPEVGATQVANSK